MGGGGGGGGGGWLQSLDEGVQTVGAVRIYMQIIGLLLALFFAPSEQQAPPGCSCE